jgi:hypothetical protein
MASNAQRGEKIMVIGTDQFLEPDMELIAEASKEYEFGNSILLSQLNHSNHEFLKIDLPEFQYLMTNDNQEYLEIKFMLACLVLVVHGKQI